MNKVFYGWWIVLACFFISFYVGGTVFYGFTAFFEPIVEEFGWSYTQVSIATSLRGLEMGIIAPVIGLLVDRFGSRKLALSGTIIVGFGLILLSLTKSLAMFYGSFFLLALGAGGCTSVVTMTAVGNWFRRNVGKAIGITMCGFGASGVLVPLIVWLIELHQWQTTLLILGLGMWTFGIPLSFVIRDKPEQYGYLPDGEVSVKPTFNLEVQEEEVSFKEALRNKTFWYISLAEAIRMMGLLAVITHVMPYLSSIGMSRPNAALVTTAIPLLSIVGRFGFGWLGDISDKRHILALTFFLMGVGLLAFSHVQAMWLIFLFLLLFSPAYGGGITLRGAILREYFGRASFGKMNGIIMGVASIGGIIGPTLAGWTFDTLGSYHLAWLAFSGLISLAIVVVLKMKPSYKIS